MQRGWISSGFQAHQLKKLRLLSSQARKSKAPQFPPQGKMIRMSARTQLIPECCSSNLPANRSGNILHTAQTTRGWRHWSGVSDSPKRMRACGNPSTPLPNLAVGLTLIWGRRGRLCGCNERTLRWIAGVVNLSWVRGCRRNGQPRSP